MTVYNAWTVEYKNGGTWTAINNVQQIDCSVGRQEQLQEWPVSTATITIRYPTGYSSPLTNFGVGTMIRFTAPSRTKPMWTGYVQNARLELGIPWNTATSTGDDDFLIIDCEGALGQIGRSEQVELIAPTPGAAESVETLIKALNTTGKFIVGYDTTDTSFVTRKWDYNLLSTWTEYPANILQNTSIYGQWRICDGVRKTWSWATSAGSADDPAVYMAASPKMSYPQSSINFSDTTNDATNRIYDQVTFTGLANTYVTRASLTFDYIGTETTITRSSTTAPWRTYTANILPQTNFSYGGSTYIDETAEWYANALTDQTPTLQTISATTSAQQTQNLDNLGVTDLELGLFPSYVIQITLRGSTKLYQIEGVTLTAGLDNARFTFNVSPSGDTAWFILDSANFGVLDQNRLGIY